jgi:outer membrane protein assembly factor BamB
MRNSDVFKIVIGEGWSNDESGSARHLSNSSAGNVDFSRVRDVVDIMVDGTNITGRADEDSVFFLVRDMMFAIEKLADGNGTARVSFYEGPWELVLQRIADKAYLTFYRGGRRPEVVIKDREILFTKLVEGVVASAEALLNLAYEVDSSASHDPVVASIRDTKKQIEALAKPHFPVDDEPVPAPKIVESSRFERPRSKEGFSFGFRYEATAHDLLAFGKPYGSDLNALLFKGRYVVYAKERRLVLGHGFLFLQTERLLASLRQLLSAWEEGRPMSVRLISDGMVVGVRLGRDDGLVISLMNSSQEDAIVVLNDLTPWDYANAVLGVAREVRRLLVEVNPAQRRNLRVEAFGREVRALSAWAKEQRRGDVINEDVERYRRLAGDRPQSNLPVNIEEASRLRFRERWRVEVEGLDLHGTALFGNHVLVSARGSMLGIEADSGAVAWRRETDRVDAKFQIAGQEGFVRAAPSGQVEMVDLHTGVMRWRTNLAPRSGGAPVLLVIEHGPAPGLVVAAEEEQKLVALDMRTGEPRWRFSAFRGGSFALRRYGRLLYVASNDSHFNAVDVEDGSLVWRFTDRTRFMTPPAVSGDKLLVLGGRPSRPEGRMFCLDAFSGEQRWVTPLKGGALTAPIVTDDVALVPVRMGQRHDLVAIDINSGEELWRKDAARWANPCALMALDKRFIVNAAGGSLRAIGARDGEEHWTTILGPTCSDDVPQSLKVMLRGGMLFVPSDTVYVVRPEDGHVIHSLGGEPPVPDQIQVDPNCSVFIAEDSGHLAMYNLTSRLSVVS